MTSEAFQERIKEMTGALYRVCYAILKDERDREDAVQECLFKAFRKRNSLRDERFFKTWVIRILINECKTILHDKKRTVQLDVLPEREAPPEASPALHEALLSLDEKLRMPVILHYIEGYPIADIAKILRLPQGTIKTRMRAARRNLKDALSEEGIRL